MSGLSDELKMILCRLETARANLENCGASTYCLGRDDDSPYWLIDDAADLIVAAICEIKKRGQS